MIRKPLFLILFLIAISCSNDDTTVINPTENQDPNNTEEQISPVAQSYILEIINVMENNSIFRNEINWVAFRNTVFSKIPNAQTIQDTYPGIREALRLLGDNHSSFRTSEGFFFFEGQLQCDTQSLPEVKTPPNIGYIKIPSFSGSSNSTAAISFAQNIQNEIASQDNSNVDGWIVDLRNNGGGNMWPMLAGVGPILGEGTAGFFSYPNGNQFPWGYTFGASTASNTPVTQITSPYELFNTNPKVAVLHNKAVASSGEAITISFIGRANTKSFGAETCGLSTSNQGFSISNNSFLNLTTAYLADRDANLYGNEIVPDEIVSNNDIIETAINWLLE